MLLSRCGMVSEIHSQVNEAERRTVHQAATRKSVHTQDIPGRTQKVQETLGEDSAGPGTPSGGVGRDFLSTVCLVCTLGF